jgi:quinoprotein glucose dehydrogenase
MRPPAARSGSTTGLAGLSSKGINYWQSEDGQDRRLIFALNHTLQAIDARTGQSILGFGKNGIVDLREGLPRAEGTAVGVQHSSPGRIWRNTLVLGSQPGEEFIAPPGDIRAYDVVTGRKLWQFHTIPHPGEFGYETNPPDGYKYIGGANNWGEMSLDEVRGIVYIPTGSPNYDFHGADRPGDNLFGNSLLALDVRTGQRLWHFQTVHHDLWDLDNTSAPQLVTVNHDGRRIDAVALAGKTGFLYVFDRVTGEPLWPIEERPVPQSDVPGERSSPTQPFPTKPAPFVRQSFTVDDVNPWLLSPDEYTEMRERVSRARNGTGPFGGLFTPPAIGEDTISMPGNMGGSNWGTTAANPEKGRVFVVGLNWVALLKLEDVKTRALSSAPTAAERQLGLNVYRQHCLACHGDDLTGVLSNVPSLVGVTERLAPEAIERVVRNGQGFMRPIPDLGTTELQVLMAYLGSATGRGAGGRAGRRGGPALPPGPVVASGGAPRPSAPPRRSGERYPGFGGNAGNTPWPDDISPETRPPTLYMSEYNVMGTHTRPPYSTLTAYDLNTGEIMWQIAPGDHLPTVEAGGPRGTGGMVSSTGIVVTKTGLVFLAGGDGRIRAYDEETGRELWSAPTPDMTRGIPVMYEAAGRQYLVISSPGRADQTDTDTPRGYIAFALPENR